MHRKGTESLVPDLSGIIWYFEKNAWKSTECSRLAQRVKLRPWAVLFVKRLCSYRKTWWTAVCFVFFSLSHCLLKTCVSSLKTSSDECAWVTASQNKRRGKKATVTNTEQKSVFSPLLCSAVGFKQLINNWAWRVVQWRIHHDPPPTPRLSQTLHG